MFFSIKKIALLTVISFVGLASSLDVVFAAAATEYQISVSQVELCKSAACTAPKVIGTGAATFDIASAAVGSEIGSYASTDDCPIGTTYTHIRVTMSRAITITGNVLNAEMGANGWGAPPSGVNCATGGADASSGAGADVGVGLDSGVPASMTVWVPDVNAFGAGVPSAAEYTVNGIETVAGALPDANNMKFLIALAAPITIGQTPPTIEVNFSTENSLGAFNTGAPNRCNMHPLPPSVSLVIR